MLKLQGGELLQAHSACSLSCTDVRHACVRRCTLTSLLACACSDLLHCLLTGESSPAILVESSLAADHCRLRCAPHMPGAAQTAQTRWGASERRRAGWHGAHRRVAISTRRAHARPDRRPRLAGGVREWMYEDGCVGDPYQAARKRRGERGVRGEEGNGTLMLSDARLRPVRGQSGQSGRRSVRKADAPYT